MTAKSSHEKMEKSTGTKPHPKSNASSEFHDPWPGTWMEIEGKRLKIQKSAFVQTILPTRSAQDSSGKAVQTSNADKEPSWNSRSYNLKEKSR